MTRKQNLTDRAYAYAYGCKRSELYSDDPTSESMRQAWEDGYRAAMRDVRKFKADADLYINEHPYDRLSRLYTNIANWIKPLR